MHLWPENVNHTHLHPRHFLLWSQDRNLIKERKELIRDCLIPSHKTKTWFKSLSMIDPRIQNLCLSGPCVQKYVEKNELVNTTWHGANHESWSSVCGCESEEWKDHLALDLHDKYLAGRVKHWPGLTYYLNFWVVFFGLSLSPGKSWD